MDEALARLNASEVYFEKYENTGCKYEMDSCILQLRKCLECFSFASIAPNKAAYEKFRDSVFSNDFNAKKIVSHLSQINENFYPIALTAPIKDSEGVFNFGCKKDGYLTKNRFQTVYDRLGKYLHADNPWGKDKGLQNLAKDYPSFVLQIQGLLQPHVTSIKTPDFNGVWVVESDSNFVHARIISAAASGEFILK